MEDNILEFDYANVMPIMVYIFLLTQYLHDYRYF